MVWLILLLLLVLIFGIWGAIKVALWVLLLMVVAMLVLGFLGARALRS